MTNATRFRCNVIVFGAWTLAENVLSLVNRDPEADFLLTCLMRLILWCPHSRRDLTQLYEKEYDIGMRDAGL